MTAIRLGPRVDEIDAQVERLERLHAKAGRKDLELAEGLATDEPINSIQRKIDQAAAACEALDKRMHTLRLV